MSNGVIVISPSDSCSEMKANTYACSPNNLDRTWNYLTLCPKKCFDNGFDYGQCVSQDKRGKTSMCINDFLEMEYF